ncbi:hypothetical protein ACFQX7_32905 [Luedemannella flava]
MDEVPVANVGQAHLVRDLVQREQVVIEVQVGQDIREHGEVGPCGRRRKQVVPGRVAEPVLEHIEQAGQGVGHGRGPTRRKCGIQGGHAGKIRTS